MHTRSSSLPRATLVAITATLVAASPLAAQRQPDFQWAGALAAGRRVRIQNVNGDISVSPSTSGKVEVAGTRHGRGRDADQLTAQVNETSDGIVVCVVWKDSDDSCDDRGSRHHGDREDWNDASMDLDVRVPANVEVSAGSVSGDVRMVGAQGRVRANSVSGDVHLERLRASSVTAHSVSGDIDASIEALTGDGDLSFTTVSGDVTLELPRDLNADLSMRSVSGELNSDFQVTLKMTLNGRMDRRSLLARIGQGGRALEVTTVSGDVRLKIAR